MPPCRLLLTGFEPFAGWRRNPSGDLVRRLGRDAALRARGLRTAVLPVDRARSVARLRELLERHRPAVLLMTGLAAGRAQVGVERIAVNVWRRAGDRGVGVPIDRGGPDGRFTTLPLGELAEALALGGAPAQISESAGTYCCNLVTYRALGWSREGSLPGGGPAPSRVGFVHLPATPESLPRGKAVPVLPEEALLEGLRAACEGLLDPEAEAGSTRKAGDVRRRHASRSRAAPNRGA